MEEKTQAEQAAAAKEQLDWIEEEKKASDHTPKHGSHIMMALLWGEVVWHIYNSIR